ncbi:MAG: hypothetical protein AB1716_09765 [Planctomycetota bacterium]
MVTIFAARVAASGIERLVQQQRRTRAANVASSSGLILRKIRRARKCLPDNGRRALPTGN